MGQISIYRNVLHRYFGTFSSIDLINVSFLVVLLLFYLHGFCRTPYKLPLASIYAGLLLFTFVCAYSRYAIEPGRWREFVMFVYPIIFLFTVFETFFMILPYSNPLRFDDLMVEIDFLLLGVHPTVWLEPVIHPVLTDLMYVLYLIYFPLPLIILGWMLRGNMYDRLEESFVVFLLCYYGAYIMYFALPVEGPRFHLAAFQKIDLEGYLLAEPIRKFIDILEPNKLDAFPSLHAAILLITMLVSYQYNRTLFWYFLPVGLGIMVSLIYCRYHYMIDVVAGLTWAGICYPLGKGLHRTLRERLAPHFWNG